MALNFPSSPTVGQTYTDDNSVVWQFDGVKWNVVTGTTKRLFDGVLLGLSMNYNLTTTLTAIDWDVETADTNNYFNPAEPSKITVPITGYYNLNVTIFSDNSGAGYTIQVLKNGTTEISDAVLNPNQAANFDDTVLLNQGDYIQVFMSESSDVGAITTSSTFELYLIGAAVGTGITPYSAFSGAKTSLTPAFSTTVTPTAITWTGTTYDTNANALALTYWSAGTPSRLTIKTPGYYQINTFLETAAVGGTYTLTLKKNGTTDISTATLAPNDTATLNQVYELAENDYIEVFASDSSGSGNITTESFLEIIRIGV